MHILHLEVCLGDEWEWEKTWKNTWLLDIIYIYIYMSDDMSYYRIV